MGVGLAELAVTGMERVMAGERALAHVRQRHRPSAAVLLVTEQTYSATMTAPDMTYPRSRHGAETPTRRPMPMTAHLRGADCRRCWPLLRLRSR